MLEQIKGNPALAEQIAEQLNGKQAFFAVPSLQPIAGDETHVEFKSTARWNLRDDARTSAWRTPSSRRSRAFSTATEERCSSRQRSTRADRPCSRHGRVKPPNVDGFVNWLTTHLIAALTHTAVMRTRTRIDGVDGSDICRVDVAATSAPVTARMSDKAEAFWVRMNNSTRALPEIEIEDYVRDRW